MKLIIRILLLSAFYLYSSALLADQPLVKYLADDQSPYAATLEDLAWLEGHWKGQNPVTSSLNEHIVVSPLLGQMPSLVRFYNEQIDMNEIAVFIERNGSVEYVVRHFHSGLIAMEPVDQPIVRRLVEIKDNHYYFEGLTFVNDSPDQHTVYFQFPDGPRKGEILTVVQRRQ